MAKIDRSRFRGSSSAATQEMVEENAKQGKFPKYYDFADGDNIIRMAPPHDGDNPWFEAKKTCWLEHTVEDRDGKKESKRRPLFCADVHGTEAQKKLGDPTEKYIDMVLDKIDKEYTGDEAKEKKFPIFGGMKGGKFVGGFRPRLEYVAYGWVGTSLHRIPIFQSWTTTLNSLSRDEEADSGDEINILTDPDEGVNTIITRNSKAKKSTDKWTLKRGTRTKALSDEQLAELMDKDPLIDIFREKYFSDTLDKTIEGLMNIDEEHGYGVFDTPEFQEFLEAFAEVTPARDEKKEKDNGDNTKNAKEEDNGDDEELTWADIKILDEDAIYDLSVDNDFDITDEEIATDIDDARVRLANALGVKVPTVKKATPKKSDGASDKKSSTMSRLEMIKSRAKGK